MAILLNLVKYIDHGPIGAKIHIIIYYSSLGGGDTVLHGSFSNAYATKYKHNLFTDFGRIDAVNRVSGVCSVNRKALSDMTPLYSHMGLVSSMLACSADFRFYTLLII